MPPPTRFLSLSLSTLFCLSPCAFCGGSCSHVWSTQVALWILKERRSKESTHRKPSVGGSSSSSPFLFLFCSRVFVLLCLPLEVVYALFLSSSTVSVFVFTNLSSKQINKDKQIVSFLPFVFLLFSPLTERNVHQTSWVKGNCGKLICPVVPQLSVLPPSAARSTSHTELPIHRQHT